MKKTKIIITTTVILIILVIFSFGIEIGNVRIGKFDDFKDTFNKDIENSRFYSEYYTSDKLLIINLWATWCKPCIEEMPMLNSLKKKHSNNKNVLFLSVSLDKDSIRLNQFLKSGKFDFKDITLENIRYRDTILALIEHKKMSLIKTQSIPKTILIKNKHIIKTFTGLLEPEEYNEIDSIISEK